MNATDRKFEGQQGSSEQEKYRHLLSRALVAVDLGAESCRVSLMRWKCGQPRIELVHRFPNQPIQRDGALRWDLNSVLAGLEQGLKKAASIATEGIYSLAVTGWGVDYVRINQDGRKLADPYCYRDPRNMRAMNALHGRINATRLRQLTGIQIQPINTIYQLYADVLEGQSAQWLQIPEFVLHYLGAAPVAEWTNASHSGLTGLHGNWCSEIFEAACLDEHAAPRLIKAGTMIGHYTGSIEALRGVNLIAACCHDTASAIAGIPDTTDDWAYISSGTWSLVGAVLDAPCNSADAARGNFTNLGAAGGKVLFHKGMTGLWILNQCMLTWNLADLPSLIEEAGKQRSFPAVELIDLEDPELALPGDMAQRINVQRRRKGVEPVYEKPKLARLIFDSLACGYATALRSIARISGRQFRKLYIVGGGSQNGILNELTAKASGLDVVCGAVESSTVGNFAVQLAHLTNDTSARSIALWAGRLQ